jgi:ABC-type antimicrobial peptide transport system, ATPase component
MALVIEGPSGSGKSTLLAILGGVLPPTSGEVFMESEEAYPFAWILQTLNALGARSVLSNAALLARLDGASTSEALARANEQLVRVGIGDLANNRARELSGGELQRLAVARALASSRSIVLADEPTNQLDRGNARHVMRALVDEAAVRGRCVIIVTHDRDSIPPGVLSLRLTEEGLRE